MTPIDALSEAVDIVEELTKGASTAGTLAERAGAALEVAGFILGLEEVEDEEGVTDLGTIAGTGVVGPLTSVECSVTTGDSAKADAFRGPLGVRVRVSVAEGGNENMVILTAADARRYAAAILNAAADEADGTTGLPFGLPASV